MDERIYGLLGRKLGHSWSVPIHAALGNGAYRLLELEPDELAPFLRRKDIGGLNVTIPYKKAVVSYCAELSEAAERLQSVNTLIHRPDGTLYGDNTDLFGFLYMVRRSGIDPAGKKALVLGSGAIGLSQMTALNISLFITAVWWLVTTLPLLKNYKQVHYVEVKEHAIRQSFARIGHTIRHLHEDKQVFWFLLAFFCYIDGVYTIIDMATAYGTALGLDTTGLLLALLVTQIVAFPSALVFGRLSGQYPSGTLIPVCIAAYAGIALFAFFLKHQWQFWVLAVVVGMFQGGIQALSRSHFAKIIPPEKSGEYFGLFDICGKGASFLGTMIVSVGSQLTGSANVGVGSLIVLFIVGFVLFRVSDQK